MRTIQILTFICGFLSSTLLYAQYTADDYLKWTMQHLDNHDCDKAMETYGLYKEIVSEGNAEVEKKIAQCQTPPPHEDNKFKELIRNMDNPYCKAKRNRYIAWTCVGAGYPWDVTMGIELRAGGILGIGGYADIGVGISRYQFKYMINQDNDIISNKKVNVHPRFGYAGGVKLYYKGLFLSLGYGSISRVKPVSLEYDSVDDYWEHSADDLLKIEKGHGVHINVGYNLCTSANGFFLGISGGIAYDVVNKIVVPSFKLKLGIAFDWKGR